jgi:hypothetical protein
LRALRIVPNEQLQQLQGMRVQCIKENGDDELHLKEEAFKKMRHRMYCWWNHCMEDARGTNPMSICVQLMIRSFGCGGHKSDFKCSNDGQGTQFI